ncbi:MAG: zinc-ribbon domain-containing protein, partial [Lapillicoccus sp.]
MAGPCSLCGAPLVPDARFCAHCGTPVATMAGPGVAAGSGPYQRPQGDAAAPPAGPDAPGYEWHAED